MLIFGCSAGEAVLRSVDDGCGAVVVIASAAPPAIEVSGTSALRGGGSVYSDSGRYAVAVCICRFADCRYCIDEANVLEHCGHLRGGSDGEANRRNAELERANAPVVRGSDMAVGRISKCVATRRDKECWCEYQGQAGE